MKTEFLFEGWHFAAFVIGVLLIGVLLILPIEIADRRRKRKTLKRL